MGELIQCELCDIFVNFDDYLEHSRECSLEFENPLTASCLTFSYTTNNDEENDDEFDEEQEENIEEEDEEEDEEDEDDEDYSFVLNGNINLENQNPLNMDINSISAILNLGNMNININNIRTIYDLDTYENYSNLEDVKTPVKNIEKVAPLINDSDIPDDTYCTICQEYLLKPVRKTLCNHFFCSKCIEPWLTEMNNTCPNCSCDLE
jgi:hypothetical protein